MSTRARPKQIGGRPPLYAAPMKRYQAVLDDESYKAAMRLGEGNLSAGLRKAVQLAGALKRVRR